MEEFDIRRARKVESFLTQSIKKIKFFDANYPPAWYRYIVSYYYREMAEDIVMALKTSLLPHPPSDDFKRWLCDYLCTKYYLGNSLTSNNTHVTTPPAITQLVTPSGITCSMTSSAEQYVGYALSSNDHIVLNELMDLLVQTSR